MAQVNPNFNKLKREYIFPIIEDKLRELTATLPDATPLNLGVGDVALPLAPHVAQAIADAVLEMKQPGGIRGYPPHAGYSFLKNKIVENDFPGLGIDPEEIFVSDGINSDIVDIQDLFSSECVVGLPDLSYPAYLDASIIACKRKILLLPCLPEEDFCPKPPEEHCDIIYLCSPNNPTGMGMTRSQLSQWIDYALREKAVILFDYAYRAFVTSEDHPRSLYEIPGAKECVIEFHSFSKTAGFTGLRCGYTVIPKTVHLDSDDLRFSLHALWDRRQAAKFNGVAYPIQRGAEAVYSPQGKKETGAQVDAYRFQAGQIRTTLEQLGHLCYGGIDSPYVWWKTPGSMSSWEFFDRLLLQCHLICVPGIGFGKGGEGYVRLSAFLTPAHTQLALERLQCL